MQLAIAYLESEANGGEFKGAMWTRLWNSSWFSLTSIFFVHENGVHTWRGRCLMFTWFFLILVTVASYTANTATFLLAKVLNDRSISSIGGTLTLQHIACLTSSMPDCSSIAVAAGTNYEDFLQSAGFPASRIHPTQNTSEAIQEVHDGKAVGTIVGNVLFSDSQSPDYCDLTMVGPPLAPDNWGFVFRNSLSSVFMNQVFPACTMQAHALIDYPDRRSHIEAPAHGEDRKYDRGNPQNPMHKGVPCKAT